MEINKKRLLKTNHSDNGLSSSINKFCSSTSSPRGALQIHSPCKCEGKFDCYVNIYP